MSQPSSEEAELLTSGTAAGLYKFLDVAIKRGDISQATGIALRTGSRKILDLEENDQADLRTLDQDDLLRRFHIKSKIDLNDKSRATYEGRFRKAVEMYLKYLDDDPTWKPAPPKPRTNTPKAANSTNKAATTGKTPEPPLPMNGGAAGPITPPTVGMVDFPIPLRPGVYGKLVLPEDLTQKEAKKVVAIVTALATEERLAITAGPSTDQE